MWFGLTETFIMAGHLPSIYSSFDFQGFELTYPTPEIPARAASNGLQKEVIESQQAAL